jgi:hypothetical protein
MVVATKFVVRQEAELSLTLASVALLFGLLFDPEDGSSTFLQTFSFSEICYIITQEAVLFLQTLFISDRITSIER